MPLKCDEDGNVYARFLSGFRPSPEIVKIAPDGTKKAAFDYSRLAGLDRAFSDDFTVAPNGELYDLIELPTRTGYQVFLLRFSDNGTFQDKHELLAPVPIIPAQVLALRDGNLFVSGVVRVGERKGKAFNGIFVSNGQLLREFALKGDPEPKAHSDSPSNAAFLNLAVVTGQAMLGADGNIYLFRRMSPVLLYVVSPSGQLLRTLIITSPNDKAEPVAAAMGRNSIAVVFQIPEAMDSSDTRIRVVSLPTGDVIADYKITAELGSTLACCARDEFTFIGQFQDQPALIHASTH